MECDEEVAAMDQNTLKKSKQKRVIALICMLW